MKKLLFFILMTFILVSCNSVLPFQMDVLRPGYFVASSHKKSILLIDNSGIQPSNWGHQILVNDINDKDTAFNTESLSGFLLESVSKYLSEEGFYNEIKVCKRSENKVRSNIDFFGFSKLTPSQVKILGDSGKVDLLVSLDRILVRSMTNVAPFDYVFRSTRDVVVGSVWRVFDVEADTMLTEFQYNDSLYWEKYSGGSESALGLLPKLEKVLPEIGDVSGESVSNMLSPHWETVNRYYFGTGSIRMKYAVDCLRRNDWEGAANLWCGEFEKGFGRSVYRAAMNMMLYSEFLKNPNEALAWSKKAEQAMDKFYFGVQVWDRWLLFNWIESLKVRSIELEMLKPYFNGRKNQEKTN